jgi:hypothetical protein
MYQGRVRGSIPGLARSEKVTSCAGGRPVCDTHAPAGVLDAHVFTAKVRQMDLRDSGRLSRQRKGHRFELRRASKPSPGLLLLRFGHFLGDQAIQDRMGLPQMVFGAGLHHNRDL